jgi:hypothetical protein
LHTGAVTCMLLGVLAAWRSHTLKRPDPIPNLYSVHSYLGMAVAAMATLQVREHSAPCPVVCVQDSICGFLALLVFTTVPATPHPTPPPNYMHTHACRATVRRGTGKP